MNPRKIKANGRRLQATIQRVEQQAYDFAATRRPPRLGAGGPALYCVPSGALPAATGTWPSLTPGKLTNQQIYQPTHDPTADTYSLTALGSATATVLNYSATGFITGKTTVVVATGIGGVFAALVQDC